MDRKIAIEVATEEVESWLDLKKVSGKKRETHREYIDNLIESISEGYLELTENKEFVQRLRFPIEGESENITSLTYKPRIKVETVQMHLQGVKPTDNYGLINAYIAALTTKPKALIKALDTEDFSIANGIAVFFM